ncbi:DUF7255 family protein [Algoriphagus namhaensis]
MDNLIIRQLHAILQESDLFFEKEFHLELNHKFLDHKSRQWLQESFEDLGGKVEYPLLNKLKFDFKVNRFVIKYDDESHFNRYRLITLKSDVYSEFSFHFEQAYRRLCRTFEKDCLKVGLQHRVWFGPPIAKSLFGEGGEPGDFFDMGAPGWKLGAFNDLQMDLQSRLHGYKIIRIAPYETLMIAGRLQRIDHLLMNPSEEMRGVILNWLKRKMA